MTTIKMYLVGGAVRDRLLGLPVKDFDYTVTVPDAPTVERAWAGMKGHLVELGFKIFLETPEYFTIRAKFPEGHVNEKITADFVLARREGPYSDNRRPDWVEVGTLEDDLRRRDFTVNAMAEDENGKIIDLFGGQRDLFSKVLKAVGDPKERLLEDPLRVFRAVRFIVTKGFHLNHELRRAMKTMAILDKLETVSADRIRDELHRCFAYDSTATVLALGGSYPELLPIIQNKGIWFIPTSKAAK